MGYDDGDCDDAADGRHEWVSSYVVNSRGTMDEQLTCVRCGNVAYAAERDEDRPPL